MCSNLFTKSSMYLIVDENVRFINKYDEALSHLIFGGSDIMLCHSYEDPLLHVPLKAIKYGATPIDRKSVV